MQIRLLRTSEEAAACIKFWDEVYRNWPCWVPPDPHHFGLLLTGRGPAAANALVQTFYAEEDGSIVASVTAVRDETYVQHRNEQMGHLLFFEALPNQDEAVDEVMKAACEWLKSRGCQAARLSLLPGWQLPPTIDAYEVVPTLFHTYNPPYYHAYIKSAAFRTEQGCVEYQVAFTPELARRYSEMVKRGSEAGVRLRTWDLDHLEEENSLFTRLFNETFRSHWGFMPLSTEVMKELTIGFKDMLIRDFLLFAEVDKEPVGFVYAVPDINQAFHRMRGKPIEENLRDFETCLRKIDHGVLLVIGVKESQRGRGVNLAMAARSYLGMMARGYKSASYTVVLDDNWPSRRTAEKLGARVTRDFNIYRRDLA